MNKYIFEYFNAYGDLTTTEVYANTLFEALDSIGKTTADIFYVTINGDRYSQSQIGTLNLFSEGY